MRPFFFGLLLLSGIHLSAQQFTWIKSLEHTYPDSLHHPFILGVASSEPDTSSIYIWSYLEPDSFTQSQVIFYWEISADSSFNSITDSGTALGDSNSSWTTAIHVTGLSPDTYYWYRFHDSRNNYSVTGRTRTFPTQSDHIKLVVASCGNIFTGYYNAYARIAELTDISAVIHLGDWAYDNSVDTSIAVRKTDPYPENIRCDLADRRQRDYLYLLDPDLRRARQMHPFIYLWDNHDIQKGEPDSSLNNCRKAFREWTAMPLQEPNDPAKIYRKFSLGPLVDLFIIDVQYTRAKRDSVAPNDSSYLGIEQYNWLLNGLQNSAAKWKLIGNQKLFTPFSVKGLESIVPNGVGGDDKSWDSYDPERKRILTFLDSNQINNVMVLSGDAHFVVVADAAIDPFDSTQYNGDTGEGSVAVEFLPSGLSSPNIDERGIAKSLDGILVQVAKNLNPHQFFTEFMDNGYGILDIKNDSIIAQVWLMDVKQITNQQYLAKQMTLPDGVNHWKRESSGTGIFSPKEEINALTLYPNPTFKEVKVTWFGERERKVELDVINAEGKKLISRKIISSSGKNELSLNMSEFPNGVYLIRLTANGKAAGRRVVKE